MPIHLAPESGSVRPNGCRMLVERREELSGGLPVIMGGDYNFGLTENSYTILTEGGYVDSRFVAENTTYDGSFQNFGNVEGGKALFCDYIFTTEGIQVESFAVVDDITSDGAHASDHNPVTAVIYIVGNCETHRVRSQS